MFLKKEKDTTTKIFDDDEWIRSLTEAQEITADILEERITYDQDEVDPKKLVPFKQWNFYATMSHGDSWHSVKEKSQFSRQQCDNSVLAPREEPKPSFFSPAHLR